jgi:glycosyltransferase involved in cell wall biosynthesis
MSDSLLTANAQRLGANPARVVWFLGPRPASWNGVMQYSLDCIEMMSAFPNFTIEAIDIPAEPRSFKRYWLQLVIYPLRAIAAARSSSLVVLYQEDLSFLIPIIRLAGGRVCMILHHVQHRGQARGPVETLKNWYIRLMQPLVATADLVLSPSDVTAWEARSDIAVPAERSHVVPVAFDGRFAPVNTAVRREARATLKEQFDVSIGDELVLLNVGTDESRKNNATLFRALALLGRKDVIVLRIGRAQNAANRQECRELANAAGVKVHFIEGARDEDMGCFYQAADIYVSPTLQEGFGRTVIEAQLVGIPVIASDLAVYRSTMGDSFLPVAGLTDPAAWAANIGRLAGDPSLSAELVQRGYVNAKRFSPSVVGALLCRTFDRAVHG